MSDYRKIPTSAEVWAAIKAKHPELRVFSSYSASDGDPYGNPNKCTMMTEYGFDGCGCPLMGAETTWYKNYDELSDKKHVYWLCVPVDDFDS